MWRSSSNFRPAKADGEHRLAVLVRQPADRRSDQRIDSEHFWERLLGDRRVLSSYRLRHGFVTLMLDQGIPLPHVMRLVGHENMATTQKYLHLAGLDVG